MGRRNPIRFIVFPLPMVVFIKAVALLSFLHLTVTIVGSILCLFPDAPGKLAGCRWPR